jgi:type IV pilus assembly protein PilM
VSGRARPKKILAFDWDARTLRIVHASLSKRGVKVDRLLSVAVPRDVDPVNPEQMGLYIRRVLDQEDIHTRHAIVDIPRDQVILNTLTLPTRLRDQLPDMVEIQIAKELPFPVGEAAIDFAGDFQDPDAVTSELLVAAIRREVLQQYVATFDAAGLRLDRIGLRPYANKVAVCELLKHAMPDRVLVIDVRPTLTEINVLRNSALAFSRAASVLIPAQSGESPNLSIVAAEGPPEGVGDDQGADEAEGYGGVAGSIQSLVVEVTRSVEAYRVNDPGARIDHVVIAGDIGIEETLAEAIQKRLSVTTEMYNPASTFGWEPDEGARASAFAASLGLVLGHVDAELVHFDFLHPKKSITTTQRRLRTAPSVAAVFVLFLAASVVVFSGYTRPGRESLAGVEEQIAKLEDNVSSNNKFLMLVEEVRDSDEQYVWVDVLHDIISSLPTNEELVITHLKMSQKEGRVTVKTKAKNRDTAMSAIRDLEMFRRPGREEPRFKVSMGQQTEKQEQDYPYLQDLRVRILKDESGNKGSGKSPDRRGG